MDNRSNTSRVSIPFILVSLILLLLNVKLVKAELKTIYIRVDGSIDPSTALIKREGNLYTFTNDLIGYSIVVQRSNIVINGAGRLLRGDRSGNAIHLYNVKNVTIKNLNIEGFLNGIRLNRSSGITITGSSLARNHIGIYLVGSSGNIISGNSFEDNWVGIFILSSSSNSFAGNRFTKNENGLVLLAFSSNNSVTGNTFIGDGLFVRDAYGNIVRDNTVNGKPLVYLEGVSNHVVREAGQVVLVKCSGIRVEGLNLSKTTSGLVLLNTSYSIIARNNLANNIDGIFLRYSHNNIISENNITRNRNGINFENSSNNNNVTGNNIVNNYNGIYLYTSFNNVFYHNIFINNEVQVSVYRATSVWDCGYPGGGNYWSDYKGVDANNDGIGDTPYVIDDNNRDRYPLIAPYFLVNVSTSYGIASGSGRYRYRSIAVLSISQTVVEHGNGTRHVFSGWYENGNLLSRDTQFSLIVRKFTMIRAGWDTEYEVSVSSPYGAVTGGGWYKSGGTVTVSVSPSHVEGFLFDYLFEGWEADGEIVSTSPTYSFIVEKPTSLTASWRKAINLVSVGLTVAALAIAASIILLASRSKRKETKD